MIFRSLPSLSPQRVPPTQTRSKRWPRRAGAALAFDIANLSIENGSTIVVARTPREHQLLLDEVTFFLKNSWPKPLFFSGWECLPYDRFSPHPEIVSQRIATLIDLQTEARIVIIAADQLLARLAPPEFLLSNSFKLQKGNALDPQAFRSRLSDSGYLSVSRVISPGEFAVRGGIIDVYPSGSEKPFRIDLFGDEIENIRFFDPESQKSVGETLSLSILPAREFPTDQNAIDCFRANYRRTFSGDPQNSIIYRDVSQGKFPSGIEFYLPLFFSQSATIFDYLPEQATWVVPSDLEDLLNSEWATLNDRYSQFSYDQERPPMPPGEISMTPQEVVEKIESQSVIKTNSAASTQSKIKAVVEVPVYPVDHQASEPFLALVNRVKRSKELPILLNTESVGRAETFLDLFRSYNLPIQEYSSWHAFISDPDAEVGICVSPLDRGLCIPNEAPEVVVESQLYGSKKRQNKRRGRSTDPEAIIRSIAELKPEDPIVHIDHGVGRYEGLKSLAIDGKPDEFIVVSYKGGGKLYIPVFNIGVLSRYIGGDADTAPLHTLGGEQWEKARARARKRAYDVGAELLKTQALRTLRVGKSLAVAEQQYLAFTSEFPFEETIDQENAIEAVREDLGANQPMDRLICGDVGFGKTEVALRATFIVSSNSQQTAILAPTTLLAQQHFETFRDRFANQPVRVACLSRFLSKSEIEKIIVDVRNGKIDILIGTHRLLQKDITFKALGLVIIDEEHRFGVRQKEQLKQMREEVDVLTLTATPIPRTLNIALSGIRSISLISTPPAGRVSIKTSVQPYSKSLIKEACLRELHRGGQVYFLHNEVSSIERVSETIRDLLPNANIQVAHGQMPSGKLETVMRDFYHQRFDILVCSTIIESGIDIPTANTIIINRADRFGLAQLHQLRGRVGRSKHQAFAFLLTPEKEALTETASRRLAAIEELNELGVGFALANQDLEIRGAGELLGEGQSGAMEEVGFTLYTDYLNRAIRDLSDDSLQPRQDLEANRPADVELGVSAFIPSDYLPDVHTRLVLYQRISNLMNTEDLHSMQLEIIDRFGLLPLETKMLFNLSRFRLIATLLGITHIRLGHKGGNFEFRPDAPIDSQGLSHLLNKKPRIFQMISPVKLKISGNLSDTDTRADLCEWILETLDPQRPTQEWAEGLQRLDQ